MFPARCRSLMIVAACCLCLAGWPAQAWDARGHRLVTYLALDGLPAAAPAWLREAAIRDRIAFQSSEPDRWRGWPASVLGHENKPDHYLDIDDLDQFGLTLTTVPPFRYEYLRALAISKHVHPELVTKEYNAARDADRTREWPGFLPHAIAEHYAKLQAAFNQIRVLEQLDDPQRACQLEQCRSNAMYHMGMLSHFVGDGAQPLHTTRHHNGWVGDNPNGYTTNTHFHSFIDGGAIRKHDLKIDDLRAGAKFDVQLSAADPWNDVLTYIEASHAQVEPLYQLEKSQQLEAAAGKAFVIARLQAGGAMLSALYAAAWTSAAPTEKQVKDFVFYDQRESNQAPASQPAASTTAPPAGKP